MDFPEVSRRWAELRKPIDRTARRLALSDGSFRDIADRLSKALQFGSVQAREIVRDKEPIGYVLVRVNRDPAHDALEVCFIHVRRGISGWHAEVLGAIMEHARRQGCRTVEGHSSRVGWSVVGGELGVKATAGFWIEV